MMQKQREPLRLRQSIQAIKDLILARELRPGDPLPTEADLMTLLDVSRSSLREAIRTLVTLDILEVRHGTGTFIGQLSLRPLVEGLAFKGVLLAGDDFQTLRQVVEVRVALDLALAPGIVERLSGEPAEELLALCDEMDEASARNQDFASIDRAFHLELAERTDNQLYCELVTAFWDVHTQVAPRLGVPSPRDLTETALAHRAMLETAMSGDLEAYRAAVQNHYGPLMRALNAAESAGIRARAAG